LQRKSNKLTTLQIQNQSKTNFLYYKLKNITKPKQKKTKHTKKDNKKKKKKKRKRRRRRKRNQGTVQGLGSSRAVSHVLEGYMYNYNDLHL